jgi:hypothetical protein
MKYLILLFLGLVVFGCNNIRVVKKHNAKLVVIKNNPFAFYVDSRDRVKKDGAILPFSAEDTIKLDAVSPMTADETPYYFFTYNNNKFASYAPEMMSLRDLRKMSLTFQEFPLSMERVVWSRILDKLRRERLNILTFNDYEIITEKPSKDYRIFNLDVGYEIRKIYTENSFSIKINVAGGYYADNKILNEIENDFIYDIIYTDE